MIEKLSKDTVRRVYAPGALLTVVPAAITGEPAHQLPGVLVAWSGHTCRVIVRPSSDIKAPENGRRLLLTATRPDGVYRLPGVISDVTSLQHSALSDPEYTLQVDVAMGEARRDQKRDYFRLSGVWNATICLPRAPRADAPPAADALLQPVKVMNLSANGMMVADPHGLLGGGERFIAFLHLGDGGGPIRVEAEAVRGAGGDAREVLHWGCRFLVITSEDQTRIIRHLHARMRERLGGRTETGGQAAGRADDESA